MNKLFVLIPLTLILNSCGWMIRMENNAVEEIQFQCGKQCKTIALENNNVELNQSQQQYLKKLATRNSKTILISACNNESKQLATNIYNYIIANTNHKAIIVNNTLPFKKNYNICANIVYGSVSVLLPNCNKKNYKLSNLVGYNFGCYNQYNLVKMIKDPRDFFRQSGYSGIQ